MRRSRATSILCLVAVLLFSAGALAAAGHASCHDDHGTDDCLLCRWGPSADYILSEPLLRGPNAVVTLLEHPMPGWIPTSHLWDLHGERAPPLS